MPLTLRITDQETARVVAVHSSDGAVVGAGCLVDSQHVLTCRHVVEAALQFSPNASHNRSCEGSSLPVTLAGVAGRPTLWAKIKETRSDIGPENDLALLELIPLIPPKALAVARAEFATPLRHSGKTYSVMGFPARAPEGRNASGLLHAADTRGLVQMDRGGALSVLGGYSGAPVWSPDLGAFIGIVVTESADEGVSWCIPSRILCDFYNQLVVRFRIPPADRPQIHDYQQDDPNVDLFGTVSDCGSRRLTAVIKERKEDFAVSLSYECIGTPPRGGFATFITYPNFGDDDEDGYELFSAISPSEEKERWCAAEEIEPEDLFTVAVVGDAGDTALTLDLKAQHDRNRRSSSRSLRRRS